METRANYAIIGLFTIAVIAAAFGFVYWFAGSESGTKRTAFRIIFTGSVAGLSKGSPVLFNGIRVGDVTDVGLNKDDPEQALAKIEITPDTPVKVDTKASLDVAILSGAAVIALSGGRVDAKPLEKKDGEDLPTIRAEKGGLASILETARSTADRANALLDNVNALVGENRGTITKAVGDVSVFTEALAKNAPALDNLLSSVASAASRIGPLSEKLEGLTESATSILSAVEPDRVRNTLRNIEGVTQTVEESRPKISTFLADASALAGRLNESAPKLDQALSDMNRAFAAIDPVKLNQTIDNTQRFTAGLASSTEDVQSTVRNANQLTAKLNSAADKIDGVMKAAENFLGSAAGQEGKSTFESIRTAMDAFRKASENLDRQATVIAQGVSRFSGVGSKQIEALSTDARRTVNTVGRAARNLEQNPSSVIFGSGRASIPEFSGR
ncbi:MlaD family protein [uncultured Enterovirga sp.]|uniref:MlaD family protein n=1 Tax=uncultured Enterovirga sp. TaxID=2026352 RepID=UPI0035CC137A